MPVERTDEYGTIVDFGRGDILMTLTAPTPNGSLDTLVLMDYGVPHEVGAYPDSSETTLNIGRQLVPEDRVAVQLRFANRESLRVVIEELELLDDYMAGKYDALPTPTPHGGGE